MFATHMKDAEDSSITDTVSSSSTSEVWSTQSLDNSSYGATRSPEQRHRAYSIKRNSVFGLRSRSNTATSTTSSFMSLSPPGLSQHGMSRPESPLPRDWERSQIELQGPRKSLFRGRKGKWLGESATSGVGATEFRDTDAGGKRTSMLRRVKRSYNQPEVILDQGLKHRISSPFDFQHLTHTDRHQLATLEETLGDRLAAGFGVVSASQQPGRDLTGINADVALSSGFQSETPTTQDRRSPSAMSFGSPPQSPRRMNGWRQPMLSSQESTSKPNLRSTRSVESFSQPGVKHRSHRHSHSVVAPPRQSPILPIDDLTKDLAEQGNEEPFRRNASKRQSGVWTLHSNTTTASEPVLSGSEDDPDYFGHALTTPDDTAMQAMTPPFFSPSLDDVAEEPERFIRPRPAPLPPMKSPTYSSHDRATVACSHPFSSMERSQYLSYTSSLPGSPYQKSSRAETLGSPDLVRTGSVRRSFRVRRQSNTWRVPEASWEDEIDYIYENALEADCDVEWEDSFENDVRDAWRPHPEYQSRKHRQNASKDSQLLPSTHVLGINTQERLSSDNFRASLLVPSPNDMPDLEPTSAASASTISSTLLTLSDSANTCPPYNTQEFVLSPSLLVPHDYKDTRDALYEDFLNEYDASSERHFAVFQPGTSASNSARSSRMRSSRRSSYDSSLMSSTQSSGLWSFPLRRSASSAGSVPELVHSQSTRRVLSFSLMVDQLSDSVVSLKHLNEEEEDDENVTPSGCVLENRTFFTSEEEQQQSNDGPRTIEEDLMTSLEFARQGSQSSAHGPVRHRQALSDGAAKLLATTPTATNETSLKPRSRAATTPQAYRQPLLSLFPTPPRNSTLPDRI